ncbi:YpjP family protein [Psychrobacillus sp. OK032]|uniref:YpjP family protein n=1 Tax=Psychrobacillus sp. OK032 TaxID=1884358 RepID=UPI0008BF114F|nr:YpjP family protein [Psychrobacillus sp. OK032]SES09488.1 YpjP-like protein [Psychrobacillus sp. OK032]
MKKWLQKTIIITVAFLTFGLISPNHLIWEQLLDNKNPTKSIASDANTSEFEQQVSIVDSYDLPDLNETISRAAREQAYIKFGNRIRPVIQDEFDDVIFPRMQEAIDATIAKVEREKVANLSITEHPSGEYHEKIFHIYNEDIRKDFIRFHVRTDKKPQDGYYFNFHYHLAEDNYSKHYALGEIFWSKNTPPKWLS